MSGSTSTGPAALPDDDWLRTADRVAVHGLGREGRSVVSDLARTNPDAEVVVLDDRDPPPADLAWLDDHGAEVVVGADRSGRAVASVDLLVRSPGVPRSHPGQVAAAEHGVPVTTALNVFFARHRPDNVVAVTATKGKSTTVSLLGHLLTSAGRRVRVAGNVGLSVLDLDVAPTELDHLVLELSSYQLADLRGRVAIGAWLNLHRDHHGWHGGRDAYVRDKGRIVAVADHLVVNAADAEVLTASAGHGDRVTFDATSDPVQTATTTVSRARLLAALDDSALVGGHNLANLAAVLAVGDSLGATADELLAGLADFQPLRHRLELVHDDGRRWVDDSIATIPEATVAAMAAFPDDPVTVLVGGFDRDQDHAPLLSALRARATGGVTVVGLPDTGHRLADELGAPCHVVADLAEAVAIADDVTPDGGVVLLSPAAASFNQFRSFEDRGDQFAALARETRPPSA